MSFDWSYVFSLLGNKDFWNATLTVIELSTLVWILGLVWGLVLALAKQSKHRWISIPASAYIWLFRSLPLLVLLVFIYNLPQLFSASSVILSSPFMAGLIAMTLSEAAYFAEIHRGGLLSIPKGQIEAGKALGMRYVGIQKLIVIPQALRVALPSLGNEYVTIVKLTSLVSVISLAEILLVGQRLYTQNFLVIETMLAVAFYYVFIVTIFDWVLRYIEKKFDVTKKTTAVIDDAPVSEAAVSMRKHLALEKNSPYALEADQIVKSYGSHTVLKGINLQVKWGEVVSIIGPSGSGKTTFIRTLNGLEQMDSGTVLLQGKPFLKGGQDIDRSEAYKNQIVHVGMVFQSFNLFPHKTILENVMLSPIYHHQDTKPATKLLALAMLDKVGMRQHANKYPHQLSGGQQQRVAIARALAMNPSIILFDEPTSALDPELVGEVLKVIESLAKEGLTMIIVTHEMKFAMSVSDRVVFMEGGHVVVCDTPEGIRHSDNQRLKQFMHIDE